MREYVASCDICQRTNGGGKFVKATAPLHPIKVDPEVWNMVRLFKCRLVTQTEVLRALESRGKVYIVTEGAGILKPGELRAWLLSDLENVT